MTIESLRSWRVGGYAIFDLTVSFLGVYLLAPTLTNLFRRIGVIVPKQNWLYLTLPLGLLFHLLFGQRTQMTINLLDPQGHYLLKIIFLVLLLLGLRGLKVGA